MRTIKNYPLFFHAAAAIAAVIGLWSASMNGWFCYQAGKAVPLADLPWIGTISAGHGRALLSAGADLLKDFLAVLIIAAFLAKGVSRWQRALGIAAVSALFVPLVVNSWTYNSGAMALISSDSTSVRANEIEEKQRTVADLEELKKKNPWTAETVAWRHTKPDAIAKLMEAYKDDRLWKESNGCKSKTSEDERKYCRIYSAMGAALLLSEDQVKDHEKIEKLEAKLAGMAAVPLVANPANAVLAKSLGTDTDGAMAFAGFWGAYIAECVPTGIPALLFFFVTTGIIAKRKEEPAVPALPSRVVRPRIVLNAIPRVEEVKPVRESPFRKIEKGLGEVLAIAKGKAKPARTIEPKLDTLADHEEKLALAPVKRETKAAPAAPVYGDLMPPIPAGAEVALPVIVAAYEAAAGQPLGARKVAGMLKRRKGVTVLKNVRKKYNGVKTTWYEVSARGAGTLKLAASV